MLVILGSTGHVGSAAVEALLSKGERPRLIARDANKLKKFADRGAEPMAGSSNDANFLTKAFEGANAVFTMIGSTPTVENIAEEQDRQGEAIAAALEQSSVPYIVNLSSIGGEVPSGTGPISGLHRQEERLNRLKANVLHLRPTYFMENFLHNIPMIKTIGINGSSIRADLSFPMIATKDIGASAATALTNLDFSGKAVRYFLGQRDLTMAEATNILGAAIGKPHLPYVAFTYEDAEKGMISAGISPDAARSYNEMNRAINEGIISWVRTKEATTPTSMEEFAQKFAVIYNSQF
jgi:uncharacterized protein YbjT (DUF2867 family)